MPWDDLFHDAQWQMSVCNACRYCEGYCPVWPTLAKQNSITEGDFLHLSNLCHDCRDCFTACMYTAPHEFDLNPPRLFAQGRERTYREYVWPRSLPRWITGWPAVLGGTVLAGVVLALLSLAVSSGAPAGVSGSPYELIPHGALVLLMGVAALWSVGVVLVGAARYWRDTHGSMADIRHLRHWWRAVLDGVQLRQMTGGGSGCSYPAEEPSGSRRVWHLAVSYGFGLTLLSTISAAILQQFLGDEPPYSFLSVPVLTGAAGGIGIVVGCVALIGLKRHSPAELSTDGMRRADLGLLWALLVLAATGLLTLALRSGPLFESVLLVHLATVLVAFLVAPYTKFTHWVFRLLALYKSSLDGVTGPS